MTSSLPISSLRARELATCLWFRARAVATRPEGELTHAEGEGGLREGGSRTCAVNTDAAVGLIVAVTVCTCRGPSVPLAGDSANGASRRQRYDCATSPVLWNSNCCVATCFTAQKPKSKLSGACETERVRVSVETPGWCSD